MQSSPLFSDRLIKPELLDHTDPSEARRNLAELVRINRNFGGHSTLRKTLAAVAKKQDRFTLLDIGAASGDTARLIRQHYPHSAVTSLDYNMVNLERAPRPKIIADAFALPLDDGSFDYVLCSLFLHHFEDDQVSQLIASFYAVARKALLVIDLERHIVPYCFLRLSKPFFRFGHVTVHDGLISIRAAFRQHELLSLATRAGIKNALIETYRPAFRLSLVARKD